MDEFFELFIIYSLVILPMHTIVGSQSYYMQVWLAPVRLCELRQVSNNKVLNGKTRVKKSSSNWVGLGYEIQLSPARLGLS